MQKLFNELDDIYNKDIIDITNGHRCPVCDKVYKRKVSAEKHLTKKNCHSNRQVFRGTIAEDMFYQLYLNVATINATVTLSRVSFMRNNFYYNLIARYYMYCRNHNIQNIAGYIEWVLRTQYCKSNPYNSFRIAVRDDVYEEYHKRRRYLVTEEESQKFYNEHHDHLVCDTSYVIRCLENGNIHYEFLFNQIDADDFMGQLSDLEGERMQRFLSSVS